MGGSSRGDVMSRARMERRAFNRALSRDVNRAVETMQRWCKEDVEKALPIFERWARSRLDLGREEAAIADDQKMVRIAPAECFCRKCWAQFPSTDAAVAHIKTCPVGSRTGSQNPPNPHE